MSQSDVQVLDEPAASPFLDSVELTESVLRNAYGHFPSGVIALCGVVDGGPVGIAASSFTSVSITPALVSVCVADSSTTWPLLRSAGRLGVSVLAEHHGETARALAAKKDDRFAGIEWIADRSDAVFIGGASLWLDCVLDAEIPAGDHRIVLLRIERMLARPGVSPIVFHGSRFRALAEE
ncbi:Flavin-dependent monooxygenase, reductase subunit HsaB [Gordonia paraffinivorans]|uniref:Flavin-dependent monooxygenase, reductase subunit HsaB n=1 Tax=Gordonia paraffinivorans TaxID=175628 RepID=A0ABD7UYF4_9ACTN|nr:flavin reductase family protein [Gordonia paraffinivorans]VFA81410.1 Flavin-dependent monooxygenase, reductase subunit HsaB [Gordonia paraffinivorans]